MLKAYRTKRDFSKTTEPARNGTSSAGALTFVIQEHHASHLHWDFRLECDGVLKSWAVPKGPSTNPKDKRLAVMVEDHPISYGEFEGTIPKGQYGGGVVKIWDRGTYAPDEPSPEWDDPRRAQQLVRDGLKNGKLSFTLNGERLHGSWALVRMAKSADNWLLIKHHDEYALGQAVTTKPISPMLAIEVTEPFDDKGWAFEPKLDGIRVLAYKEGKDVSLVSRGGLQIADRFPVVTAEIRSLPSQSLVLDGEIVAFDADGRPDFEEVMAQYHAKSSSSNSVYFVFDLLGTNGNNGAQKPYSIRRRALEELGLGSSHLKIIDSFPSMGKDVFENAVRLGFEGVIAKRLAGTYQPGARSNDWRKIKRYHSEDFYVGGWVAGKGHRARNFGALLLGSKSEGKLIYRGNVGGGFSDDDLQSIGQIVAKLDTSESPFTDTPAIAGDVHWIKPVLLAEVRYMALTKSNRLRFPTFIKMRNSVEKTIPPVNSVADDDGLVGQLMSAGQSLTVRLDGHELELTHLDKELWPKSALGPGVSKRDLLLHYARVGRYILPHLKDRPLAFVRYPQGLEGPHFFQKHVPESSPNFLRTVDVYSASNGRAVAYVLIDDVASLLWLGQMGALELHPWQSRITPAEGAGSKFTTAANLDKSVLDRPDFLVLDLDPYTYSGKEAKGGEPELNTKGWAQSVEVALKLRDLLESIGIHPFLKTSGKTGLHIFVPIHRNTTYEEVRASAKTLGEQLMQRFPDLITMEWSVKKRPAKVYFDFGQNVMGKTLAAIYSTRPAPGALVSFPVAWEQLMDIYPTDFTVRTIPALMETQGDIWANILDQAQPLPGTNA